MVELRDTERRNRIIEAAREEFGVYGHAGARVQRIVDRAGVNKQLMFYYFGSKNGLYRAVMEDSLATLRDMSARDVNESRATMQLRLEIRSVYLGLVRRPELVRLLAHDAVGGNVAGSMGTKMAAELEARLSLIVSEGQKIGYFREDADPDEVAKQGVALILGHVCLDALSGQEENDPGAADRFCDLLLRGLEW